MYYFLLGICDSTNVSMLQTPCRYCLIRYTIRVNKCRPHIILYSSPYRMLHRESALSGLVIYESFSGISFIDTPLSSQVYDISPRKTLCRTTLLFFFLL